MPCIQKWKAAPKQLPISKEAESEMRLTWQGRSLQRGAGSGPASGAAGAEPGHAGAVGAPPASPVGWAGRDPRDGRARQRGAGGRGRLEGSVKEEL